ncbi:MAG: hypothetical protein ACUZ8I_14590 [Candidatus Scalindua sp.]
MNNYFVAVGGTGQQVALDYLRLTHLCGIEPANIIIVDSDITADKDKYCIIDRINEFKISDGLFMCKPIPDIFDEKDKTFSDIFKVKNHDQNVLIEGVLSLFFRKNELEHTDISKGMFGIPREGATAIISKLILDMKESHEQKKAKKRENVYITIKELIGKINGDSRIVICGSVCGGTGAGGVPRVSGFIKKEKREQLSEKNEIDKMKIVILDFLEWFKIQDDGKKIKDVFKNEEEGEKEEKEDIFKDNRNLNNVLKDNASSGVFYLKNELANDVEACVFFGLENLLIVDPQNIGSQQEKRHLITLLAAITANNSFNSPLEKNKDGEMTLSIFPDKNSFYGYVIPDTGLTPDDIDVNLPEDKEVTIGQIIESFKVFVEFLKFTKNYFESGPPKFSFTPWYVIPNNLRKVLNRKAIKKELLVEKIEEKIVFCEKIIAISFTNKNKKDEKGWFTELCDKSSETDPGTFKFDNKKIKEPSLILKMPVFSKCIESLSFEGKKEDEIVDQIIKGIRITINSKFLK